MNKRTIYTSGEEFRKISQAYDYFLSRGVANNDDKDTLLAREIVKLIMVYSNSLQIIDDKEI